MKILRSLAVLPLFTAACCAPVPQPAPAPKPVSTPAPPPTASPPVMARPAYDNWYDAPQSPGDWSYTQSFNSSAARFGNAGQLPIFVIGCSKNERQVYLTRPANSASDRPLRIVTETAQRLMNAKANAPENSMVTATLPASDPLLDAMALSRGRFAVETGGLETLYLPAWPEISRVIEDCR